MMLHDEWLYQIALTRVEGIGDFLARLLVLEFGSASAVFKAKKKLLERLEKIGPFRAKAIASFNDFNRCEKEIEFLIKHKIQVVFFNHHHYPKQLYDCYDAPVLLYFKGSATLENQRFLSIVGTRNPSIYGIEWTRNFVKDLQGSEIIIVSGLAEGIDTIAHESALQNGLNSIGVLGHGLHTIYPAVNRKLAARMIEQGGLLTHFPSGTNPERQHFPSRNRITGGICDALVVVETGIRGGSLITADLAYGYQKEIFALPGRVTDLMSAGTNQLIQQQQAIPIHNAFGFLDYMKWRDNDNKITTEKENSSLFFYPSEREKKLLDLMIDPIHIDELSGKMEETHSQLASILLQLELKGVVMNKPGKRYQLNPTIALL